MCVLNRWATSLNQPAPSSFTKEKCLLRELVIDVGDKPAVRMLLRGSFYADSGRALAGRF